MSPDGRALPALWTGSTQRCLRDRNFCLGDGAARPHLYLTPRQPGVFSEKCSVPVLSFWLAIWLAITFPVTIQGGSPADFPSINGQWQPPVTLADVGDTCRCLHSKYRFAAQCANVSCRAPALTLNASRSQPSGTGKHFFAPMVKV